MKCVAETSSFSVDFYQNEVTQVKWSQMAVWFSLLHVSQNQYFYATKQDFPWPALPSTQWTLLLDLFVLWSNITFVGSWPIFHAKGPDLKDIKLCNCYKSVGVQTC